MYVACIHMYMIPVFDIHVSIYMNISVYWWPLPEV